MIPYRVKQVIWALTARPITQDDSKLLDEILTPAERQLFDRFSVNDQNHSLRVVRLVGVEQSTHFSLKKAALLHDIGKVRVGRLSIVDRSIAVALKRLLPKRSQEWGSLPLSECKRYQVPSVVRAQHAAWGAEMVEAAGGDPLTVSLIRRHQDRLKIQQNSEEDALLDLLQAADNAS